MVVGVVVDCVLCGIDFGVVFDVVVVFWWGYVWIVVFG